MNSNDLYAYIEKNAATIKVDESLKASILFDLSGPDGAKWQVLLDNGNAQVAKGAPANPDVTVSATMETALGLFQKTVNPMMAFLTGKIKIKGDPSLIGQIKKIITG